jgi:hypothetical protein
MFKNKNSYFFVLLMQSVLFLIVFFRLHPLTC